MTEGMNVKDYDYDLPEELIAQDPLEDRSSSRLMVLDRQTGDVEHRLKLQKTELSHIIRRMTEKGWMRHAISVLRRWSAI